MSEPRRILLTHFDLDGVACDILMSKLYTFEKKYKCGYAKMKKFIADGNMSHYDSAIVTDMSLSYGQYMQLSEEYGGKFLYIDHHGPSVDMVNRIENRESPSFVNKNFAGAGIVYQVFKKKIPPAYLPFIVAVDSYDCWRWKTHPDNFDIGYNLNILFWQYGYNNFYSRFFNSPKLVWTNTENKWVSDHAKKRDKSLIESDKTEFGKNSLVVIDTPKEYINDYGIQFPEYDNFYMLYTTHDGKLSLSVRTVLKDVNIGETLQRVKMGNPYINTAGGHPEAGGMDFNGELQLDLIIDIIEDINNDLEGNLAEDVPF